ncbi:MAG: hypothetical protein ACOY4U_11340 [Pseudomonadota bacterium]
MLKVEPINPGFSTADAECPEFSLKAGALQMTFEDWTGSLISVEFQGVVAFSWQEDAQLLDGEPYDGACEIFGSDLVARHLAGFYIPKGHPARHLRFNFNACGQLEVVCESFAVGT